VLFPELCLAVFVGLPFSPRLLRPFDRMLRCLVLCLVFLVVVVGFVLLVFVSLAVLSEVARFPCFVAGSARDTCHRRRDRHGSCSLARSPRCHSSFGH